MIKRSFDFILASLLLILALPIMLLVSVLIRIKLGRPIFFTQERPGFMGTPFIMYKFRSMLNTQSADGKMLSDEQRLTSFGRFLRATSLDELPELINVVKGDMSLVGPRPLLMAYLPLYSKHQFRRHEMRPGITGWAQVNGRNALDWSTRFDMDVWYVDHHSFWLDLKIMFKTIVTVFSGKNVNQQGHVTMSPFKGNDE